MPKLCMVTAVIRNESETHKSVDAVDVIIYYSIREDLPDERAKC